MNDVFICRPCPYNTEYCPNINCPTTQNVFKSHNFVLFGNLRKLKVSRHEFISVFSVSPRMTIYTGDTGETHVGVMVMTPYFNLLDNSVYVGGVPSSVGIDSTSCPVRISLVGGIRNLQINNGLVAKDRPLALSNCSVFVLREAL